MPQMSPLYWLILMFYFIIMLMFIINMIYFTFLMKPNFYKYKLINYYVIWLW